MVPGPEYFTIWYGQGTRKHPGTPDMKLTSFLTRAGENPLINAAFIVHPTPKHGCFQVARRMAQKGGKFNANSLVP